MNSDPNKKSARTFQCRDVLWETFEQMARELECSVDYLINEAMKQYARQRSYGSSRTPYPPERGAAPPPQQQQQYGSAPPPPMMGGQMGGSQMGGGMGMRGGGGGGLAPPPPPPQRGGGGGGLPPPPQRGGGGGLPAPPPQRGMHTTQMQGGGGGRGMPQQMGRSAGPSSAPRSAPPPIPNRPSSMPPIPGGGGMDARGGGMGGGQMNGGYAQPHGATLSVMYQGDKMAVTKDRFVIGRGKQSSDLTLKDPNVSRQHAMIEYQNGVYFMVDMGSTNGVEYNGQRIARKQIAEGDVFRICDHDLRFTYR